MATGRRLLDELGMDVYYMFYKHTNAHTTAGFVLQERSEQRLDALHRQQEPRTVLAVRKGLMDRRAVKQFMWEHRLAWNIGHFHKER